MVSSLYFREILLFSLIGSSVSNKIHLTARQEGGSLGAIPLCVVSAEGALFTETSGVLPTAGCPGVPGAATGAAGITGAGVTGGVQPISVSPSLAGVSSTSVSPSPVEISSIGSSQGPVSAAPLPSFITIPSGASGSGETFSQTVFPDLATLTTTETVTTGIVQTDASGGTTTVQGPIVVGPGGIGFIGQTGALPTGVSIDDNGNPPGGSNNNNPGGDNNNNNNDGDNNPSTQSAQQESTASASASASSTEACIFTEVACTQTCTVSSISGSLAPTTSCGSPGLCRRQVGGGGCTSTTGTTTSTYLTTASASAFICKAGSCAGAVCGTSAPNIAPAITTNAPGDQIPSLANLPNPASKRSHRRITRVDKIIKRVVDVDAEDPTSIRQLDFTDPNSLYSDKADGLSGKEQWYTNAQMLVGSQGPGNLIFAVGEDQQEGGASSTKFNYADLRQNAITTGSGPSWGCTSVLVYSERGVWIAHFWEQEQMQAADFNGQVLNFIRSGEPGRFEGLSDVVPSLFSGPSPGEEEGEIVEVPVFSGAIIFTPSFRRDTVPPGSQPTDPIYSDQVNQIKTVLVNQVPGFTLANMNQKINVATYQPVEVEAEMVFNPWLGLLTFEYVPQHVSNDNNACEVLRAIRIHIQDAIQSIIAWNWPGPSANPNAAGSSKSKSKRQGACPVNLPQILSAQGDGTAEPASFFDISTPVSGVTGVTSQVGPAPASGSASPSASPTSPATSLAATTSSQPPPAATTAVLAPSSTPAGPVLCSNWELSPNGVQVGTDCDGDLNKTVTVTGAPGKRAVKTVF
ncbi:uncharacterized protein BP5553_10631 [Venustampulla echinocandica]|uniref:Uncharacterized protein n=1 Tax=Venustampulla echinocandica TaxID=2656787 RepID=A0A370T937_9HELO|nr:uncharacterized protein BP5553_10631 [Venustampulla echinocandica]RDL30004.1 hypothetical protein BP5553_10631 [Venustampulla echinocandica]